MPGGSVKKTCPQCRCSLFCAQKVCKNCGAEQPKKPHLKKRLQNFDKKRRQWVSQKRQTHNMASVKDEAVVLLEKLHALGYKPLLLLGKDQGPRAYEVLTPRCQLDAMATKHLGQIAGLFEFVCSGWSKTLTEVGDTVITLYPVENLAAAVEEKEERATVEELKVVKVEPAGITNKPTNRLGVFDTWFALLYS
ncbi:hypothetical protein AALO_G00092270 [Alosa alosa]|uniref:Uncharacterized protein n=1 Tax=Alosa alosa TaxID=278164 RepID=A0AAV6GTP0_9TELE|nr:hypothetical protein AALO_G00092270 [Alosa alosa]